MPDILGPKPVDSREAYEKHVQDHKDAQLAGTNLPAVAYDQPGQVISPEQLPDPRINLMAGFAPQDISSVVVLPREAALTHPSGPEAGDWFRGDPDAARLAAKWASENAESYDEQQKLNNTTAPERAAAEGDQGSTNGAANESGSSKSSISSSRSAKS